MIKIPGTDEGVPAIEQAIYEGININVTLLFAVEAYAKVAEAYIRGPRAPPRGGQVARRALGRLVLRLARGHRGRQAPGGAGAAPSCRATPALANARAAYQRFKQIFHGERFAALREAGRPVQRPLWASTGRQEPALPRDDVRRRAGRPRHRQHDADADAAGRRRARRDHRRDRRPGPDRRPRGAGRRRASTWTTSPTSCWRDGIETFEVAMDKLIAGRRGPPRGRRHRPPADDRVRRSPTSSSRRSPSASSRRRRGRRPAHLAQGRHAVGARPGRRRSPTGSAG